MTDTTDKACGFDSTVFDSRDWYREQNLMQVDRDEFKSHVTFQDVAVCAARWQHSQDQTEIERLKKNQCPETCYPPTTGGCDQFMRLESELTKLREENERLKAENTDIRKIIKDAAEFDVRITAEVYKLRESNRVMREAIKSVFVEIEHGDSEHRSWLYAKLADHFKQSLESAGK